MRILILALSGIGDALMFTPALKLLRNAYPDAQIDALVMFKGVKDIYSRNGNLNNVLYYNFMKEGAVKSLFYLLKLRGKYDAAINVYPSNRKEYNIFSFLIGARKRAAVDYIRMNRENMGFLNNVTVKEDDNLHNVEENIRMVEKLSGRTFTERPCLDFPLSESDKMFAGLFLKEKGIEEGDLVIGFHPGSATLKNHVNRRWEPEKFSELGRRLIDECGAKVLVFGGPEEDELKKRVADGIASSNAMTVSTGDLAQSAAVMKRCNLFVSNDSSLMHVAASMNLKVAAIIGPTNTNYIYPWSTEHRIISLNLECAPCFFYSPKPLTCFRTDVQYKCVREITVEMVFGEVKKML
jgi:heptosyltransferase-2